MNQITSPRPDPQVAQMHSDMALSRLFDGIPNDYAFKPFLTRVCMSTREVPEQCVVETLAREAAPANAIAKAFRRDIPGHLQRQSFPSASEASNGDALMKAQLDVASLTNMASITGGQTLGYVSLDTQMARGTVRPSSFTLYQALTKTPAFQIVDYWPYIDDTGGALPGAAFAGFGGVSTGTLATNAGHYQLQNVFLKLLVDGRSVTTALMAQNSFVDVVTSENANAALSILATLDWAMFWGNSTNYPNQFNGIASLIPTKNIFDFQVFYAEYASSNGWSYAQTLYNMIYQCAGNITSYGLFGRTTHAFMTPMTNGSLQQLITTTLNNIVSTISPEQTRSPGVIVNGDLQGMRTRWGVIQFAQDLMITARDTPAQAIVRADGTTPATTVAPSPPASVTAATATNVTGSAWTSSFAATGSAGGFVYAVASTDINMNESVLTYTAVVTGVTAAGSVTLTISPPGANDAYAFRVYRSGMGYAKTGGSNTPYSFRYIGYVVANGTNAVTFVDLNTAIPGGESIFLLDLADEDNAIDYRYLLPISRIELFAQNLYMPWAVATIGALRLRIPKFHGIIKNYVPDAPLFNPLSPNN